MPELPRRWIASPRTGEPSDCGRAARRRRFRGRLATAGGLSAVLLAVGLGCAPPDPEARGPSPEAGPAPAPEPETGRGGLVDLEVSGASAVLLGEGAVWVGGAEVVDEGGVQRPRYFLARLDPATGREQARIDVPGPIDVLAAARPGEIWGAGGGDGGVPDGGVFVVAPARGEVVARLGYDRRFTPSDIAAADGTAWISSAGDNTLLRVARCCAEPVATDSVAVGGQPGDLVATGDGTLWVQESLAGTISRIDAGSRSVAETRPWPGRLLTAGTGAARRRGRRLVRDPRPPRLPMGAWSSVGAPERPPTAGVSAVSAP